MNGIIAFQRAWKCIEKIPIDESAFPPHVKPAAIIIGVKGSNHARMQDEAGCCVQLRGRGISSVSFGVERGDSTTLLLTQPGTPGADEPIHLWVKYDTPDQLQRVRDVLQEIIRSCEKGPPPELRKKSAANGPPLQGPPRGNRPPTLLGYPGGPPGVPMRPPMRPGMPPQFEHVPDVLPPLPDRPPASPLECFFTLHYLAHAAHDLNTEVSQALLLRGAATNQLFGAESGGCVRAVFRIPIRGTVTGDRRNTDTVFDDVAPNYPVRGPENGRATSRSKRYPTSDGLQHPACASDGFHMANVQCPCQCDTNPANSATRNPSPSSPSPFEYSSYWYGWGTSATSSESDGNAAGSATICSASSQY